MSDGTRGELHVPRMIALPLRAASLYHQFKGTVMPHELLNAIELHLASPDTTLDNGDEWGLVQKWLIVASQKDGDLETPQNPSRMLHFAQTPSCPMTILSIGGSQTSLTQHWAVVQSLQAQQSESREIWQLSRTCLDLSQRKWDAALERNCLC
jgi:hypothetical protein